eukprot:865590-Pelagomonas_calceolata.AAC.1
MLDDNVSPAADQPDSRAVGQPPCSPNPFCSHHVLCSRHSTSQRSSTATCVRQPHLLNANQQHVRLIEIKNVKI